MSETTTGPDLSACAREPIHVPGAVQPHGVLLAIDGDGRIRMASANAGAKLGGPDAEALLGRPLADALGEEGAGDVVEALGRAELTGAEPLRLAIPGAGWWDAILHRSPSGPILELEPADEDDPRSVAALYARVRSALARLQRAHDLKGLQQGMAEVVADLTGMDKVMVYRFDEAWNGEVVAERGTGRLPPYLGLRFPATDIPAQARELYRRNWLRLIADVDYEPVSLVPDRHPDTGEPLDLSGATLRSVSPIHLAYLRNMAVGASMSVSLLEGGRLWGLVACHHATARHLPYALRTACEFLGQTFSVQLGALAGERDTGHALELERIQARVIERLAGRADWLDALTDGEPALEEVVDAGGAAVRFQGGWIATGRAPDTGELGALCAWLEERGRSGIVTDRLSELHPPAEAYAEVASGLLAARLGRRGDDWILWFRPEQVETVRWAGDPRKAATVSGNGEGATPTLSPRSSFDAWKETVRGRARPWLEVEVEAAEEFRLRIVDVILRQAEELGRLAARLRRSNEELDAFTYIAGHDLKAPVRGVHTWASILKDRQPDAPDGDDDPLQEILWLTQRMEKMLDSLLNYARAEHLELDTRPADLQALVEEVLAVLRVRIDEADADVRIPRPLPTVTCDPVRVASVFQNLLSNALKYNDSARPRIEITWSGGDGEPVRIRVEDNGIGIAEEDRDRVFQIFQRLHPADRYGGGAGAGLTITRRLVERHGGRIGLDSAEGGGAAFIFTLEPQTGV